MTSDSVFIMVFQNITRSELNSRQSTAEHSLKYPVVFAFLLFVVINGDFIFLLQTRENEIGKSVCRSSAFSFLGAFAKCPNTSITFIVSVRLSVRMEQLGPHWRDFREIWYSNIFRKCIFKI